jgi:hypothetical protein
MQVPGAASRIRKNALATFDRVLCIHPKPTIEEHTGRQCNCWKT